MRIFLLLSVLLILTAQNAFAVDDTGTSATIQLSLVADPPHYLLAGTNSLSLQGAKRVNDIQFSPDKERYGKRLLFRGGAVTLLGVAMMIVAINNQEHHLSLYEKSDALISGPLGLVGSLTCAGGLFLFISGTYYIGQLHGNRTLNWTPLTDVSASSIKSRSRPKVSREVTAAMVAIIITTIPQISAAPI